MVAKHTPGRFGWRSDASLRVPFLTLSETPTGVYYSKYPVVAFGCRLTPPSPLIVFVFDELNDRLENDTYHQHRPSDECEQPAPSFAITTTLSRAPGGPTAASGSAMAPDSASRPSPATALPTAHNGERSGQGSYIWLLHPPPAHSTGHVSFFSARLHARRSRKHVFKHHAAHPPSILLRVRFTYPAISAGLELPINTRLFVKTLSPKPASLHASRENPSQ